MDLKITPSGQTIVKPTALGPGANTDTKLLIYGLFQKGRVLAQDGVPSVQFSSATNVQFTAAANTKARILEAFSKFAETRRRGTGAAIGEAEQKLSSRPSVTSSYIGTKLAEQFVSDFGDGGKRTSLATIRIADERAYQAVGVAKRLADTP